MSLGRILGSQNGSGARAAALWGQGGLGARWTGGTCPLPSAAAAMPTSSGSPACCREGAVGLPASSAEQSTAGGGKAGEGWGEPGGSCVHGHRKQMCLQPTPGRRGELRCPDN